MRRIAVTLTRVQSLPFAIVGQKHLGPVGFLQDYVLACMGCLWFERNEQKDRLTVARRFARRFPIRVLTCAQASKNTSRMRKRTRYSCVLPLCTELIAYRSSLRARASTTSTVSCLSVEYALPACATVACISHYCQAFELGGTVIPIAIKYKCVIGMQPTSVLTVSQ